MKYLVTGSGGFIGGHLARTLAVRGHFVRGFDLKDGKDLRRADDVLGAAQGMDGIFHLGAVASVQKSIEDPHGTFAVNVTGTRNVFEAARQCGGIPVVYASSAAIYGDNQNLPLSESEVPAPLSPYAEHKIQNERDAADSGLRTFGLRFFNIYGPGQDPSSPYSGVISIFHDRLKAGLPITIYGDGLQTRDFVAVDDTVRCLMAAMEHVSEDAPVANVCTGTQTSLLGLAAELSGALGMLPDIRHEPARAGDIRHSCGNPETFARLGGFTPRMSLREGLDILTGKRPCAA